MRCWSSSAALNDRRPTNVGFMNEDVSATGGTITRPSRAFRFSCTIRSFPHSRLVRLLRSPACLNDSTRVQGPERAQRGSPTA